MIEIEFQPAKTPGTYWPIFNGEKLTQATRQPFFDSARSLLKLGVDPEAVLVARHAGSKIEAMRSTVGEAAKWSCWEADRGRIGKTRYSPYVPFPAMPSVPPAADEASVGVPLGGEGRGPFSNVPIHSGVEAWEDGPKPQNDFGRRG